MIIFTSIPQACEKPSTPAQYGTAKITQFDISPASGSVGTTFDLALHYDVLRHTSTGEVLIVVVPPLGEELGDGWLIANGAAPASYTASFQLPSMPNMNDPFNPGEYRAVALVCDGTCGSKHRWARILAETGKNFTLTA
jgi:hypothetical protein